MPDIFKPGLLKPIASPQGIHAHVKAIATKTFTGSNYAEILKNLSFLPVITSDVPTGSIINITDLAPSANWSGGQFLADGSLASQQALPWMGPDSSDTGFVRLDMVTMEDGNSYNALRTHPMWCSFGTIKGLFSINLPGNGLFKSRIGFLNGATGSDGVTFSVNIHTTNNGADNVQNIITKNKRYSNSLVDISADLSKWANQDITLELEVDAGASSGQDWAAWINPTIEIESLPQSLTYINITPQFNTTDLSDCGINKLYQKINVPNTFLIVPSSYSITLDGNGKPAANLEEIVIVENSSDIDKSSASLVLGLAPYISDFQLVRFKTIINKTLQLNLPVALEYPAGDSVKLTPQSSRDVFSPLETIELIYVGSNETSGNHFLLKFSHLGLTDMAGFMALLKSQYSMPIAISVNSENDENSSLNLSFANNNITGNAISVSSTTWGLSLISIKSNTDSVVHIESMAIEGNDTIRDLKPLNITIKSRGEVFSLPYPGLPRGKDFAFAYTLDFDEQDLLNVDITDDQTNQLFLTITCPQPNSLPNSEDFFDHYNINQITVSFSDPVKYFEPKKVIFSKDTARFGLTFILLPAGSDFSNKKIAYKTTVSFTNGQADLHSSTQHLDLSLQAVLSLTSQTLKLK